MSEYTTEQVELLLPYLWNELAVAEGTKIGGPRLPDPSLPSAQGDPSKMGNLMARWLDVKDGFETAPLTERERRAVVMCFGFDMKKMEIAEREGCSKSTMSARLKVAVKKITVQMNGTN